MHLYPRDLLIGIAFGTVTNVIVSLAVLSSPSLSETLGADVPGWVNGILIVEIVRMCLVASITLVMIRQRHGIDTRRDGAVYATAVGLGTWVVLTVLTLLLSMTNGPVNLGLDLVANLCIWTCGAALAAIFVSPGAPSRDQNRYLDRLDRERSERSWS